MSTNKILTGEELKRKAQVLVNLARAGDWTLIQGMLEADFPEELAEFMLDKVQFAKTSILPQKLEGIMDWGNFNESPCELEKATWFSKISKKTPQEVCAQPADNDRAIALALALVTLTGNKSRHRVAAAKIKCIEFDSLGGKNKFPFEATQMPAVTRILNRGLGASPNLVRLNITNTWGYALPINLLSLPEHIKVLRVTVADGAISVVDIPRPNSLKILELSAPRIFLADSILGDSRREQLQLRINPRELNQLDPGIAECLLAENCDLDLYYLKKLDLKDAEVLARCAGEVEFGDLQLDAETLTVLRGHKSFQATDLNRIWHFPWPDPNNHHYLADGNLLILGSQVLDLLTGCSQKRDSYIRGDETVAVAQRFICTLENSYPPSYKVTCRRIIDKEIIWSRVISGANKIIPGKDLIVLKNNAALSKHSILDGRMIKEIALGRTSGGSLDDGDFIMSHHVDGGRLFLWSQKNKYQGGKWLVAINMDSFIEEWSVHLSGVAGGGMVADSQGRLLFAIYDKVLRLDPATGAVIGKPIRLGGSWSVVRKCYSDGSIIAGCQKGFGAPEMKCFDDQGGILWNISLASGGVTKTALDAGFYRDFILIPFVDLGGNRCIVWVIDRKTGKVLRQIDQKAFDLGIRQHIACFDNQRVLVVGELGCALYDGLPSSWT